MSPNMSTVDLGLNSRCTCSRDWTLILKLQCSWTVQLFHETKKYRNQGHSMMPPKPGSILISHKITAGQWRVFRPSLINFRLWQLHQAYFHSCPSHKDFYLFTRGSMSWSFNSEEEDSSISFPFLLGLTSNFKTKLFSKYSITVLLRWDAIVDDLLFVWK